VRCDYDWQDVAKPVQSAICTTPRVEKVLNYVATKDWVVAAFPKAMQLYRSVDLGGAGHDGFKQGFPLRKVETLQAARNALQSEQVIQLQYVEGRHDAAIREMHWGDIASFVVTGTIPWLSGTGTKPQQKAHDFLGNPIGFAAKQPLWSRLLGRWSSVLFPILVAILVGAGAWLFWRIFQVPPCIEVTTCAAETTRDVVTRILLFFGYFIVVRIFITRY